jgi:hypothetical protein
MISSHRVPVPWVSLVEADHHQVLRNAKRHHLCCQGYLVDVLVYVVLPTCWYSATM